MQVAPPTNGKKLWRVKRASCSGPAGTDSSLECLNNSLRISAAGKLFMQKRPPSKRPRSKPGMPKDFVFVDLSPIKSSEDDSASLSSNSDFSAMSSALSANTSASSSPTAMSRNNSISNSGSYEEPDFSFLLGNNVLPENDVLGLGLLNLNCDFDAPQSFESQNATIFSKETNTQGDYFYSQPYAVSEQPQRPGLAMVQQNAYPSPELSHKRARSVSTGSRRKSAGGILFKTYKGPKTSQKVHKRCLSESFVTQAQMQSQLLNQCQLNNSFNESSLASPLATPTDMELDLNAFIKELELDGLHLGNQEILQSGNEMDMFGLSNISDIPEYSETPSINFDLDTTAFTAF